VTLREIESLSERIGEYNQQIEKIARDRYPQVEKRDHQKNFLAFATRQVAGSSFVHRCECKGLFPRLGRRVTPAPWGVVPKVATVMPRSTGSTARSELAPSAPSVASAFEILD
jgi:hypothetical protein